MTLSYQSIYLIVTFTFIQELTRSCHVVVLQISIQGDSKEVLSYQLLKFCFTHKGFGLM